MKEVSILRVAKFVFFPANFLGGRMERIVFVLDTFFPARVLIYRDHKYPGMWYYKKYFEKEESINGLMIRKTSCPSSFISENTVNTGKVIWKGYISNNLWDLLSEVHDESYPEDRKIRYAENYNARGISVEKVSMDEELAALGEI